MDLNHWFARILSYQVWWLTQKKVSRLEEFEMMTNIFNSNQFLCPRYKLTRSVNGINSRHHNSRFISRQANVWEFDRVWKANSNCIAIAQMKHWLQSDCQSATAITKLSISYRAISDAINLGTNKLTVKNHFAKFFTTKSFFKSWIECLLTFLEQITYN